MAVTPGFKWKGVFTGGNFIKVTPGGDTIFPHCQLLNPTGSNRTLSLRTVVVTSGEPGQVYIAIHSTPLTTLSPGIILNNKFEDQDLYVSTSELRVEPLESITGDVFWSSFTAALMPQELQLPAPVTIYPGTGLVVSHFSEYGTLSANWQWVEQQL